VPLGLGREVIYQESYDKGAEDRHQNDQWSPGGGRREEIGVVADHRMAGKEQVVNKADQISENHGSKAGDDTET
jgi:hypothetical protein